ncbi:MAG: OmpA family protein [Burkholderiaceae bacterium]
MKLIESLLFAALALTVGAAGAQVATPATPRLAPEADRITDAAIHADYKTYEAVQARIKALNDRGLGQGPRVADWALAKAQCWLDVSFHEYTRNDRSAFPQEALAQSDRLVRELEAKRVPPSDTPLVNGALRLREDLWAEAARLRDHPGWSCAAPKAVCAEVELVHAGNEEKQQGWRHAKPYVQIAEDGMSEAATAAARCAPPAPLAVAPVPAAAPTPQAFAAGAAVLFDFAQSAEKAIRPLTRQALDAFIARIQTPGVELERITVIGYADRLNRTGRDDYNRQLSLARAATVAALLKTAGVDARRIQIEGRAEASPVEACAGRQPGRALQDCLLPNRRVEIEAVGWRVAK